MPAIATPFDSARLDRLMDEAGIDVLLATSNHNVQYLLGGHRAFFFDYMDAMGLSRYLPIMVYPKGNLEKAAYFGHRLENFQHQVKPLWTPEVQANSSGALDAMQKATDYLRGLGVPAKRIGIETTFMPMDAGADVLVVPFSHDFYSTQAVLWQAQAGMRFAMPEGYIINRAPSPAPVYSSISRSPVELPNAA